MKFCEVMGFYDYKKINIVKALNISRETVNNWHRKNKVPFSKQCEIEVITKGVLKAHKEE